MANNIVYPTVDKIIEYNLLVLNMIKVKKADKAEVLNQHGIVNVIDNCKEVQGDIYDKAVCLLKGLIQSHSFASGNRRTAFVVVKDFVNSNKGKFGIKDDPKHARVMQGIRENYYTGDEIKEWIKNGKIRRFER
jgi:prophage maintenance system killer protein|tara:strand:- start:1 stop:402 length:402 start_codon:yes stop_codon:yes gene_type:complete